MNPNNKEQTVEEKKLPPPLEGETIPKEGIKVVRKGKAFYCICECGNCNNRYFLPFKSMKTDIVEEEQPIKNAEGNNDVRTRRRHKRTVVEFLRCNAKDLRTQKVCGVTILASDVSAQVEELSKK